MTGLIVALLLGVTACTSEQANQPSAFALTGTVSSQEERDMEGVVVIVQAVVGEVVLTAVTTDAQGQFEFNRDQLESWAIEGDDSHRRL